ncbi:Vitamin B12 ABC transporter, permease protein BtuC [hydrothermal vent metagenome]|uniref:Vitamin B12 ABC transporter, permease protein BtuC n=1 Tax=hydrothermal vent metagenome TaxID=652676 RepID=A0A3B0SQ02_9ZZZZ
MRIKPSLLNGLLAACLLIIGFLSLFIGTADIAAMDILSALTGTATDTTEIIILELRLPRILLGILAGASLGLSGAALQGLLKNPLADPGVIGVSATAGLGAVIAIYFGLSAFFPLSIQLLSMAGALLATLILSFISSRDSSVLTLILAGIGISSLATAAISLAMNFAPNPMSLQDMIMWLLGSLENRTLSDIAMAAPFIIGGWLILRGVGQGLDASSLGEDTAQTLGINLKRLRMKVIVGSAISVGATVSVCGAIGFVGLVVPHMIRSLIGHAPGRLLVPSALLGAIILTIADLLTRLPVGHGQLRLGVVTAFVGSPLFLYIIYKTRGAMR